MAKNKTNIRLTPKSKQLLGRLAKAGKVDMRPVLKVVGIGYRKEVKAVFDKKQPRDSGLRWVPLSPGYAAFKSKNFPGRPLLVRTGDLKKSMTKKGAKGNITLIGKNSGIFGSTISYGIFHDEGTSRMPKRNFSEPSERRALIWKGQIERDIRRQFEIQGIDVEGAILA